MTSGSGFWGNRNHRAVAGEWWLVIITLSVFVCGPFPGRVTAEGVGGVEQAVWKATPAVAVRMTPDDEIRAGVERVRAEIRATGGRALRPRLGATHYDGRYFLTEEPYLVEGAKAMERLGFRIAKFWFNPRGTGGYGFHSEWKLDPGASLVDLAKHRYFQQVFQMPFDVIFLEVTSPGVHGGREWEEAPGHLAEVERQLRELTVYLLESNRERKVTFVLQNWEGDWMVREGAMGKGQWPSADAGRRFAVMREWLMARQRGVDAGRREVKGSKARVYHALEVNRVMESLKGVPTLTTEVVPRVDVDMLSWSCYDGLGKVTDTWRGVEILRQHAKPGPGGSKPPVFIGEIGLPENEEKWTEAKVSEWWEQRLAVFLALDVPWIVHWELYCNEPKDGRKGGGRICRADELRGFWLLRPDGSLSHAGQYLESILRGR